MLLEAPHHAGAACPGLNLVSDVDASRRPDGLHRRPEEATRRDEDAIGC